MLHYTNVRMLSDKKEVVCLAVLRPVTDSLLLLVVGMTIKGGGTTAGRLFFIGRALVDVGATVGRLFTSGWLIVNYIRVCCAYIRECLKIIRG